MLYSEYQRITRQGGKTGDLGVSESYISRSASKNSIYKSNFRRFFVKEVYFRSKGAMLYSLCWNYRKVPT